MAVKTLTPFMPSVMTTSTEAAQAAHACALPVFPQIRKLALESSLYHLKNPCLHDWLQGR